MITGNKMLNGLVDDLNAISLSQMASALQELYRSEHYNELDHISFLSEILAPEYSARMDKIVFFILLLIVSYELDNNELSYVFGSYSLQQ